MTLCDGCGAPADDRHIRERIARLELATRFRPIHIKVLFLDAAPPARPEDYFYRAASDPSARSVASRAYFNELGICAGLTPGAGIQEDSVLADFQRHGFFLAHACECPIGSEAQLQDALRCLAPVVLRRIETSYKPRHIALLSSASRELVGVLRAAGFADRLILNGDGPFSDAFGDRLSNVLAALF